MPTPKSGYHLKSGKQVPSVTTILSRFKESGGLLQWAFQQGRAGKSNLYEERDKAADAGTIAHDLVFEDLHGSERKANLDGVSDDIYAAACTGFENYKKWQRQTKLFIMPLEVQLVDEEFEFGGTPDAGFEIEGELDVGDWKTSNGIYLDYIIQGAAYRRLWNVNHPETPMAGLHICRFSKEGGNFAHHYYDSATLDVAWDQFVLFRKAYELDKVLKKRL